MTSRDVLTVGTFDGVHLGHQAVLAEIARRAAASGGRSVLVTFEPHPLEIVNPPAAPQLLTTADEKRWVLAESPVDHVMFLPFTPALAELPPERFVREELERRFALGELVIGYDHGFGRGRAGWTCCGASAARTASRWTWCPPSCGTAGRCHRR